MYFAETPTAAVPSSERQLGRRNADAASPPPPTAIAVITNAVVAMLVSASPDNGVGARRITGKARARRAERATYRSDAGDPRAYSYSRCRPRRRRP